MQSVFKTILGILIMVMILFSGLGVLWANNEAVAAENYIQRVADEVSTSNLREDVLKAEVEQAKKDGYTLSYIYFFFTLMILISNHPLFSHA